MKSINFAKRNFKELRRDPLSIIFAILLPLFILFIFQQIDIPSEVYDVNNFTPGIIIFSFSFITLFTASLVAKDRSTSLLTRLGASPMKPSDYILGYALAVLPVAMLQCILFFALGAIYGLTISLRMLLCIVISILISTLFIMMGILIGSVTNEKSSSGLSSVIIQVVAFTSGMYFPDEALGKGFQAFCEVLPFYHAVKINKTIINGGDLSTILPSILIVLAYTIVMTVLAIIIFKKKK